LGRALDILTDSAYNVQVSVEQMLFSRVVAVFIAGFRLQSRIQGAHLYRQAAHGRPVLLHPQLPESAESAEITNVFLSSPQRSLRAAEKIFFITAPIYSFE
jgi:hypothetical protein